MAVQVRTNPAVKVPATDLTAVKRTEAPLTLETLFVYGSLNDDHYFRLITGITLPGQPAVLPNYRRVQPERGFAFAIPWQGDRIEGRLLTQVTPALLAKLDEYESAGTLYSRETVQVLVGRQTLPAYVYIAHPEALRPYLEKGFAERDRIEEYVERSVHRYLEAKADRCLLTDRKQLAVSVTQELLSEEIQGLLMQYFLDDGLPPFIIKHEIEKANLPDLAWLETDRKAQPYASNYLAMAVKFMVFNQLEARFRDDFRGHAKIADALYQHTLSALMALKLMVDAQSALKNAMIQLKVNTRHPDFKYPDYAVAAIFIAEELYQANKAQEIADWVRDHHCDGVSPLGAELEFSPLGVRAVSAREGEDPQFDSFYYFYDFDLMRRGWKLGAHIDDHGFVAAQQQRSRGFMELAFGRYRLLGDVSKPATQDPWVLAKLIDLAVRMIDIRPHSLHISIQADADVPFKRLENPEFFLCLLLLGGDLREDNDGKLREMRIFHQEILHPDMGVYLSRLNRHHQNPKDNRWQSVVEYQFPRLYYDYDYQPLILALKGFQRGANPYPFKDCHDCPDQELHKEVEIALKQWATFPAALSDQTLNDFMQVVAAGLDAEASSAGPAYRAYVTSQLQIIERQLRRRNQRILDYHQRIKLQQHRQTGKLE